MPRAAIGDVVAQYRIERPLGEGAMGEVYLARDTRLDRLVALKILASNADGRGNRRVLREARAIAAIDHPAICAVYEVGSDPGLGDFIVMQYVEGETLASRLVRGPLPVADALRIAASIADALAVSHASGVVHRDLKPHNVMLARDGSPKLVDFGIARRLQPASDEGDQTTATGSRIGRFAGTPAYASPEQFTGHDVDGRSDLFSLGCILYECLAGRRAFTGPTPVAVMHQVVSEDPVPPSSINPALTAEHDALCARLLQRRREDRFQTAGEAREAIDAVRGTGSGDAHRPASWPATDGLGAARAMVTDRWTLAVVAVIVLLVAAAAWQWIPGEQPVPPPDAVTWFDRGVESMREGSYAAARGRFEQAIALFPDYLLAHARLAEALMELDEQEAAKDALLVAQTLRSERGPLPAGDQRRLDAVTAAVQRDHPRAIAAYRDLADAAPGDARRWLDVGRAEESASHRLAAREAYAQAVELDPQYAAAHLGLGRLQGEEGRHDEAMASFDRAAALFRAATNVEGEAETGLHRSIVLTKARRYDEAVEVLEPVLALGTDSRFQTLGLRARFQIVRIETLRGDVGRAEQIAEDAIREATDSGLQTVAALGLNDAGLASQFAGRVSEAEARFTRAIALAVSRGATLTEHRARLHLASLSLATGQNEEALHLATEVTDFFESQQYRTNFVEALLIRSRALESLARPAPASDLARRALVIAEELRDDRLRSGALDNLAGQETRLGLLPQALQHRETVALLRDEPFDTVNRAELLVALGRTDDARLHLDAFDQAFDPDDARFAQLWRRAQRTRVLLAVTEARWRDAADAARSAIDASGESPDSVTGVLLQVAQASSGRPVTEPLPITHWPDRVESQFWKGSYAYWAARTLMAGGHWRDAYAVSAAAIDLTDLASNLELRWRLTACAALAASRAGLTDRADALAVRGRTDLQNLLASWSTQDASYLSRADLKDLVSAISFNPRVNGG